MTCPPHHWLVDNQQHGTCCKCGAEKDFPLFRPRKNTTPVRLKGSTPKQPSQPGGSGTLVPKETLHEYVERFNRRVNGNQ